MGVLTVLLLSSASVSHAAIPEHYITSLPLYGKPPSAQYSGLLSADLNSTVMFHYWFVTSTGHPTTDPITLWMNGGPGCSSIDGMLTELGPFSYGWAYPNITLTDNPSAWTTVSSVIFLDQPIGVGFSYATNGSTQSDDYTQSQNTYNFLLHFFASYPEFSKNRFFIAGESYAGIFVPTLASQIVDGNAAGQLHINLQGIAVGNGCLGNAVGSCGSGSDSDNIIIDFLYGHGMISSLAYENISQLCGDFSDESPTCEDAIETAAINGGYYDIDPYNVYYECFPRSSDSAEKRVRKSVPILNRRLKDSTNCKEYDPSEAYLNTDEVKKALHVEASKNHWVDCAFPIFNTYGRLIHSLLPLYPKLISHMNVMIYSGDADPCVPWNGSYNWTRHLGMEETVAWRPWRTGGDGRSWVGGFVTAWGSNFSFVTVKHAGHMVPLFEPEAALTFYTAFLNRSLPQ